MQKRVLVIGAGGREHALVRQLAQSPQRPIVIAAPGNPGTATVARNIGLDPTDHRRTADFCGREQIDLVIIGPEDPLIAGLADHLRTAGIAVFGPGAAGARLEGDKEFAKQIMDGAKVPTAAYRAFSDRKAAADYLKRADYPLVVKACGAAQGKGVAVCSERKEAIDHLDLCMTQNRFGKSGQRIIVEECLVGPELSVLAVTDGKDYALLSPSRDHKRIGEGDSGPNTGGMGAFAPVPLDAALAERIDREVIAPVLAELRRRGVPYRGVLYAGLMLTAAGPKVLEFNCRFGDPEAQVVLPLLTVDFLDIALATAEGRLGDYMQTLGSDRDLASQRWPGAYLSEWNHHCVIVVGAAAGYPGSYRKGAAITLPEDREPISWIVHAGTHRTESGLETAGGRVLGAVAVGSSLSQARQRAYDCIARVDCEDLVFRRDIAAARKVAGGSNHG